MAVLQTAAHAATQVEARDDKELFQKAELVLQGVVSSVEYRMSEATKSQRGLPHTFVTFDIERVFKGTTRGKQITLRFFGGRGEGASFTTVSGYPLFDKGDRDILFVQSNGSSGCPLVNCENGRLRVINGLLFSDQGRAVESSANGMLKLTDYYDLPEVTTHYVANTALTRRQYAADGEGRQPLPETVVADHIDGVRMANRLVQLAQPIVKGAKAPTPQPVESVSIDRPFSVEYARAVNAEPPAKSDSNNDDRR
jgi:hypothetical protein